MTKDEFEEFIKTGNAEEVAKQLIGLAFYEEDYDFALRMILLCTEHSDSNVRGNAILCLGHLARIHKRLPVDPIVSIVLNGIVDVDEYVRGQAYPAKDDIELFIPGFVKEFKKKAKELGIKI